MKLLIVTLLSFISIAGNAQQMVVLPGVEKTVAGLQTGLQLSYETKRLWALGTFYQVGLTRNNTEGKPGLKNTFYGMILQAPIAKSERLAFLFSLRSGLINEKFLVLVPSVETRIAVTSRMGVSVGAGFRMGYPSLSAKVFFRIFNSKN